MHGRRACLPPLWQAHRSVQGRVHIWDSGNIIADIGTETVYYIRVLTLIYAKKGEIKICRRL